MVTTAVEDFVLLTLHSERPVFQLIVLHTFEFEVYLVSHLRVHPETSVSTIYLSGIGYWKELCLDF
jgi:hypothetical protein